MYLDPNIIGILMILGGIVLIILGPLSGKMELLVGGLALLVIGIFQIINFKNYGGKKIKYIK